MAVDYSLTDRLRSVQAEGQRLREASDSGKQPLEPGGGGGDSGGMDGIAERVTRVEGRLNGVEDRLGRIETRMDRLDTRMDGIDTRLRGVEQTLAAVNGKLDLLTSQVVAKLPSWWQMPAVFSAMVALFSALYIGYRWILAQGLVP
jgi:archaellum component FlaC